MKLFIFSLFCLIAFSESFASEQFKWDIPTWAPKPTVPADNPMTKEKVLLGRHLFYDKRLSIDKSMSCATCHVQSKAFTNGKPLAKGVDSSNGVRNVMSLTNVSYLSTLTWSNPQITSLEFQSLIPLFGEHPVEMGMAGQETLLFKRLKSDKKYQSLFKAAFPEESLKGDEALFTLSTITKAIASFQRTLISLNSPYDQYKYGGNEKAISESAKRGERLFFGERMECYHCHGGFNFTDTVSHARLPFPEKAFHNTGLYNLDGKGSYPKDNIGIAEFTGELADIGKFRTPTLRNIAVTGPYMHDGSIKSIRDVLEKHYSKAGMAAQSQNGISPLRHELITGFYLEEQDIVDVTSFLKSLTDKNFINNPSHSDPWKKTSSSKKK